MCRASRCLSTALSETLLGVPGSRRDPQLRNVPTLAERGLDGYQVEF